MNLKTIYEDDNILILDKPQGMLSHAAKHHEGDDIISSLGNKDYAAITRLDYQTAGLMLIGKNKPAISALNRLSMNHGIRKTYESIVIGYFPEVEGVLSAFLLKDEKSAIVRLSNNNVPGSVPIVTTYRVLKEKNGYSQIEVGIESGKTHQIRAHLAFVGHPVLGDPLYGNLRANKMAGQSTQLLVSMQIEFNVLDPLDPMYYLNRKKIRKPTFPFLATMEKR